MAQKTVVIKRYADGTIGVKVGRQVEAISVTDKSKYELFEAVRWAIISKDYPITEVELTELMREA